MATLLRFILEFQRKCRCTDIVDIVNIDVQYCTEYMPTLLRFLMKFQRKCQGTYTVDIDNIDDQ
jgi:hypothetical protein